MVFKAKFSLTVMLDNFAVDLIPLENNILYGCMKGYLHKGVVRRWGEEVSFVVNFIGVDHSSKVMGKLKQGRSLTAQRKNAIIVFGTSNLI